MKHLLIAASALLLGAFQAVSAQCGCPDLANRTEVIVSDIGDGTGTTTWTCNNTYLLDGYVFVNDGQALTIEPGTVIKGMAGAGADAAALIVARGGQIFAEGTADCPITFTHQADPLDGSVAYDLSGQWGGVIILGDAPTNLPTGEGQIEGIPADNDRAAYGGSNANDNSGVLNYVSIRHGGTTLSAANEINGLTLGGVGAGTTIHHIEVVANEDDGIEFFGGTVEINYAAVAFAGDDSFDWDQGFSGGGHHWFSINKPGLGDRGGELDGDDSPNVTTNGQPFAIPTVTNWTIMGQGSAANKQGLLFRAGTGGHVSNVLIVGFGEGIEIEDIQSPSDAFDKWAAGDLTLENFRMQDVNELIDYDGVAVADGDAQLDSYAAANNMSLANVGIDNDWATNAAGTAFTNPFNPVPTANVDANGAFAYMGAFDANGENWLGGWSYLDESGAADTGLVNEGEGNTGGNTGCDCPDLADRTEVIISDAGQGTGTTTWTCNNTYLLDGYVFVNDGQALTIEPGTVIKGMAGAGADAAALIVARGGQIFAEGTADCPITFTHQADPLDGSVAYDLSGQWGGVIILGDAPTNLPTGEGQIEGIPADNDRAAYGGSNANDNSGVLSYVSIRHGGTTLSAANEINGLTLGGVGAGTTIHHIEVVANEDDGIEFFGGTVEINYAAVAFAGDDSFDWDQGFSGGGHHWFSINKPGLGDRGGELDGDDSPNVTTNGQPFAIPTVTNWTIMGQGSSANKQGLLFRAGTGGHVSNVLIVGFGEGIEIEDVQNPSDAFDKWAAGDLTLENFRMQDVNELIDYDGVAVADGDAQLDSYAAANNMSLANVGIDNDWATNAAGTAFTNPFNPVPTANVDANGAFAYMGAFDADGENWLGGWSYLDESGAAATGLPDEGEGNTGGATCDCPALADRTEIIISDAGQGTGTTTWTCNNTYLLDGYVFVNDGQALTIEPGTVIKGMAGSGADASALIVARGGQIFAEGTETCPIIFTFEADPLDGSVAFDTRGQWGGVIILGDATTNLPTGEGQIEGVPADNDRAAYGGSNDADNSGVLSYVSIRHGGTTLAAANEINGLTLGGVGSGTTIHHIEIISNEDDGIEFFGGSVNVKHLLVAFAGDDSFDYDQGWHGNGQFWTAIQDPAVGDRAGEFDGDDSPNVTTDGQPYATPHLYNVTVVGRGIAANKQGFLFRAGAGGHVHNAVFANIAEAIELEDIQTPSDAFDKWATGDLTLSNITMTAVGEVIDYDGSAVADGDAQLDNYAAANGIGFGDAGIDFEFGFNSTGVAVTNPVDLTPSGDVATDAVAADAWFDAADYRGAFAPNANWAAGWTYLDGIGFFAEGTTTVAGCTDVNADNYDAAATVDDGSCIYSGCTDETADNYDAQANEDDGSCVYSGCTDVDADNYDATATVDDGSCLFTGCTDNTADNFDPQANTGDPMVECQYNGCTNETAVNFNAGANTDDGSCQFEITFRVDMWMVDGAARITGDFTADASVEMEWANYSLYKYTATLPAGTYSFNYEMEDGTSEVLSREIVVESSMSLSAVCFNSLEACAGCTNAEFADFNPHAGEMTGCELAPVAGCTYADATNFNAQANVEDGSCTFELGSSCPGDLNDDGAIGTNDLLAFLASFGTICE